MQYGKEDKSTKAKKKVLDELIQLMEMEEMEKGCGLMGGDEKVSEPEEETPEGPEAASLTVGVVKKPDEADSPAEEKDTDSPEPVEEALGEGEAGDEEDDEEELRIKRMLGIA